MISQDSGKLEKAFELSFKWNIPDFRISNNYSKEFLLPQECGVEKMVVEMTFFDGPRCSNVAVKLIGIDNNFQANNKTFMFVARSKVGGAITICRHETLDYNKVYRGKDFIHFGNLLKCCINDELGLIFDVTITNTRSQSKDKCSLVKSMNSLLLNKDFTDCTFLVNGQYEIKAHKVVLAARSPCFYKMFAVTEHVNDGYIKIDDVSIEAFESFLYYVYTGGVNNLENYVNDLSKLSSQYEIQGLKQKCDAKLAEKQNGDEVQVAQAPEQDPVAAKPKVVEQPIANLKPEEKESETVEEKTTKETQTDLTEAGVEDRKENDNAMLIEEQETDATLSEFDKNILQTPETSAAEESIELNENIQEATDADKVKQAEVADRSESFAILPKVEKPQVGVKEEDDADIKMESETSESIDDPAYSMVASSLDSIVIDHVPDNTSVAKKSIYMDEKVKDSSVRRPVEQTQDAELPTEKKPDIDAKEAANEGGATIQIEIETSESIADPVSSLFLSGLDGLITVEQAPKTSSVEENTEVVKNPAPKAGSKNEKEAQEKLSVDEEEEEAEPWW